jgi:nitric oxide synthase oxygenase domain/subunit/sulfite reductase alpha subunit-like flavoprotein/hemoglobin-like flavoprotein
MAASSAIVDFALQARGENWMKPLEHSLTFGRNVRSLEETAQPAVSDVDLSDFEKVIVRDTWNKMLPFDGMLLEMFFKRLLIEAPELERSLGCAIDGAPVEFLRLFDLAVRGLTPESEDVLREGYRAAPSAADAQCADIESCGWWFAAHGLTEAHWVVARNVFLWLLPQIPYLEAMERESLREGEGSAFSRFFDGRIAAPMLDVLRRATPDPAVAAEMRRSADALAARGGEAGAFFYQTLFERHPHVMAMFGTTDMSTLSRHLIQSIAFIAHAAADGEAARREVQTLAVSHRAHGVAVESYALLADPLIETLRRFSGPMADSVEAGWRALLRRTSLVMAQPAVAEARLKARAREFLDQIARELGWTEDARARRWAAIETEIRATGTYTQTTEELTYGAKLAWRNAPKCIGRIAWRNMTVRDRRHVGDPDEIFAECAEHLRIANNGGAIEIVMTVFAPMRPGERWGPRIWNSQLIRFAGWRQPDGSVLGDGANVALTEAILAQGWTPPAERTAFDVLPLVVDAPGHAPKLYQFDPADLLMVDIEHPTIPAIGAMGMKWCAVPAIANFRLEIGGLNYGCLPFNGWFMGTEIARNLWEERRYGRAEALADALGLDTSSEATLWRDRAFLELNVAIIHSFSKNRVMLVDHHTASNQFMLHDQREKKAGRECPAQWSWIAPAAGGSTTAVWHHEMRDFNLRPTYAYAADRWAVTAGQIGAARSTAERPPAPAACPLILFASETGTAEAYARQAARRLARHKPRVLAMDEATPEDVRAARLALVVSSTFRDGEIPTNGQRFMDWLSGEGPGALAETRFAVLGIGNRIYPKFCAAAAAFDAAFDRAGARRIAQIERADELSGQTDVVKNWIEMVSTLLDAAAPEPDGAPAPARPRAVAAPRGVDAAPVLSAGEFWAEVAENAEMLRDAEPGRSTRRLVLDVGDAGAGWRAGEHVAIHPMNPGPLVEGLSRRLGFSPDDWVRVLDAADDRLAAPAPLRRILGADVDLAFPEAPEELISAMLAATEDPGEQARLGDWRATLDLPADDPRRKALRETLAARYLTVLDLLDDHPSCALDLGALLDIAPRLKPRFYSIASSPRTDARRITLAVSLVRRFGDGGRSGVGVCSGYLARLRPGDRVRMAISRPPRRLPDDFCGPLLLVGAGTGVAPLVGALEDRESRGIASRAPVALYFGCRDVGEFLFDDRLTAWREKGLLSRLGVAFSRREARRAYVQDLIEADAARVWRILSARGAHVLVCGDARMADAVRDRLVDVAMREGDLTMTAAHDMIAGMRDDGRFVEDVWGVHLNRTVALKKIADERYSQGARWFDLMKRRLLPLRERSAAQRLI